MEKLTIRELAPYLPYGLKFGIEGKADFEYKMKGLTTEYIISKSGIKHSYDSETKPLLRPLSQLTEEIEHNGGKINVLNELHLFQENVGRGKIIDFRNGKEIPIGEIEYGRVQTLLKYHFDVFGLIEKGLAIEISK